MYINQPIKHNHSQWSESFDSSKDCLFVSGDQCYVSQGIRKRFSTPINDTKQCVSTINETLKNESKNTKIFGVIPFCKQQQAQFILPEKVTIWEKAAFTSWLDAESASQTYTTNTLLQVDYLQSQTHFEKVVNQAKALFASQQLQKIVLSKQAILHFDQPLNEKHILKALLQQSQNGYHFSFPTEQASVLMGVSPELLLRKYGSTICTNPLAGSIPRHTDPKEEALRRATLFSSKKDRFEHAVVIEDMQKVMQPFCKTLEIPSKPSLLSTATMWHLSSVIHGELQNPITHILDIANQLHPTPALCGKPTKPAYEHILELEGHGRGLFSGIVGWCDKQGNGEWVVVIRCGEIQSRIAKLFAGAGIVAASNARSEWLETEAKLNTMLNALGIREVYHSLNK